MFEQRPGSDGRDNPSPILRFAAAMRMANEMTEEAHDRSDADRRRDDAGFDLSGMPDEAAMAPLGGRPDAAGPLILSASDAAAVAEPFAQDDPHTVDTDTPPSHHAGAAEEALQLSQRFGEIEAWIEKLAERFDQLEFVIVEQFEPGMSQPGERPGGNLRERLDRIEATLGFLSQDPGEPRHEASGAYHEAEAAVDRAIGDRLNAIAARLAEVVDADVRRSARADAAEERLRALEGAVETLSTGADASRMAVLDAIERVSQRPPPVPDMTLQHRSFAGFATALQATLDRFESSVGTILDRLDGVTDRVAALEAGVHRFEEIVASQPAAPPPSSGLDLSLASLSDRLGALAEVLGTRQQPADLQEIAVVSARLEQLGGLLSAALEEAGRSNSGGLDETLRDLRMAIAEIAAENRRLHIA